ncbi:phage holin, partial [Paenibacillus sp. FSL R5-0345]|uniref:phage holin n=1 Tax=Paenibacillus sp. FSL R5-0345 TaxID=1536770 RepID=UPI0005A9D7F3
MNDVWEAVQPQVTTVIISIVGILATVVLGMLALLQTRVKLWLDSKTSVAQREMIHKIAAEAYAYAEKEYKNQNSASNLKLNAAFSYTSDRLGKAGIKVTPEEIKGAIEKAVQDYKIKQVS